MFTLLRRPVTRRSFIAHAQSQLGSGAAYVALVLIAYARLHSGWGVTAVLLADFRPGIALSPLLGALADRRSRRTLAVSADLVRGGAFIALACVSGAAPTIALALVAGAGTAVFRPAVNASLPRLVAPEERSQATGLYGLCINVGITVGPALCAIAVLSAAPAWVLAVNGVSFLVSAGLLSGVPMPAPVAGAVINVAEPLLATGTLRAGPAGYAVLVGVYGIGSLAGSAASARLGNRVRVLRSCLLGGLACTGLAMVAAESAPSLAWALPAVGISGFATMIGVSGELRLLHDTVPESMAGRVFGVRESVGSAAFALVFVLGGLLTSLAGPRGVYIGGGAGLLCVAALGALAVRGMTAGRRAATVETREIAVGGVSIV